MPGSAGAGRPHDYPPVVRPVRAAERLEQVLPEHAQGGDVVVPQQRGRALAEARVEDVQRHLIALPAHVVDVLSHA
jgi:hypothetical protein